MHLQARSQKGEVVLSAECIGVEAEMDIEGGGRSECRKREGPRLEFVEDTAVKMET